MAELETGGADGAAGGFVLPRLLRKPARTGRRLLNGSIRPSRRGAVAMLGILFAGGAVIAADRLGFTETVTAQIAPKLGLTIDAYDVSGNSRVSEIEIVSLLAPENGKTLLFYDVRAARETLKRNPWIADAEISKRYPGRLDVRIIERQPFAVWQNGDSLSLIDREGRRLGNYDGRDRLPLVVGEGASEEAAAMLSTVSRQPEVAGQVRAFLRIGERRWDLQLANGTVVMLPETGVAESLDWLAETDRNEGLLARAVDRIDLRIEGKMTVRLTPDAAAEVRSVREEQFKRLKAEKKGRST